MSPALSVVIVADVWASIERTAACIRAQTIHDRIELVVVLPEGAATEPPPGAVDGLAGHVVVTVPTIRSLSWVRAPGIRAASAPVVVLAENHCFPDPGWAEALVRRHEEPWAGVGPAMYNANPGSVVSWINLILDYGPWLGPTDGGELDDLPGHNSAYKRDVLVAYGDALEELLEAESMMHARMRAHGHRLYQEPEARARHLNVTQRKAWLSERFQTGRRFGGSRGHGWPVWRRAVYAGGSPLIPLVRWPRVMRDRRRTGIQRDLPVSSFPGLALALYASALGELVGYAAGSGESMYELSRIELHKERYIKGGVPAPSDPK